MCMCFMCVAIVIETLEQIKKNHDPSENFTMTTVPNKLVDYNNTKDHDNDVLKLLETIENSLYDYLYPCLIEYSLICATVFYVMWKNVGRPYTQTNLQFNHRHIYRINCARVSRGLLVGGIILFSTILTLIPDYVLQPSSAVPVTHVTQLTLLTLALIVVCISFLSTSKLYYNEDAHVNFFDQILIMITTIGDFAYTLFGLFASVLIDSYTIRVPRPVEIILGLIALVQTFLQTAFILDSLKRRMINNNQNRTKPGREWITTLLLINLCKYKTRCVCVCIDALCFY